MVRTVAMAVAMFMIQVIELVAGDVTEEFMGGGRD